ncbi:MAG: response regulator transcription factor [Anaerolineae bacterium]
MKIVVADDHSLFRDGLISLLEAAGFEVVAQVGNGQQAVDATRHLRPDVVLLDINMPQLNGLEALKLIKDEFPQTQVIMLTVSDNDTNLFEAIKHGAQGYLSKDLTAEQFLSMLDGVQRGEAAMTRETTARLIRGIAASQQQVSPLTVDGLTDREIELLQLVANGLSNKAVAQQLLVSENTVKYHMKNILQKLRVQNRTEAVTHAIRYGLIAPQSSGEI